MKKSQIAKERRYIVPFTGKRLGHQNEALSVFEWRPRGRKLRLARDGLEIFDFYCGDLG